VVDSTAIPASAFLESPTDDEILELVHHALRATLDSPTLSNNVQKVKGLLYEKKWLELFGDATLLESYAGRWVPSRACCYRELFAMLGDVRRLFIVERDGVDSEAGDDDEADEDDEEAGDRQAAEAAEDDQAESSQAGPSTPSPEPLDTRIISLGGGASSELLAVAALVHACMSLEPKATAADGKGKSPARWSWTGVDIGAWGNIVDKFQQSIQAEWDLGEDTLGIDFVHADLLKPAGAEPAADSVAGLDFPRVFSPQPSLVTLLFTLTELLTQSRPATFTFLRSITTNSPPGTFFLVADSASDLSEFEMGSSGRKWPIHMILDTMLLGPPSSPSGEWEPVRKEDSRWFRMGEGVGAGWPVKLENTRYWLRLYRRL
jgi:25S rRNA (uracil2843-N3)-methyltransferase